MTAHINGSRLRRSVQRRYRTWLANFHSHRLPSLFPPTPLRHTSIVTFAAPTGYCLSPEPILTTAGALAVVFGGALVHRDRPRAVFEAIVTAFALAAAVPFVTAAGLPSPTPDAAQVAALLVVAAMINICTSRSLRAALAADSLAGAGCAVAFAVLTLKAVETGQLLWGVLALVPVSANLLGTGVLVTPDRSLMRTAERLLGLPHPVPSARMTGQDLAAFTGVLRRITGSDLVWAHITLPAGGAWAEASADGERVHCGPPKGHEVCGYAGHPVGRWRIPRSELPDGWRAGTHVEVHTPDGRKIGCLLLGWTRLGSRYRAGRMTNGVLADAVTGTARRLGAVLAETHAAHDLEAERSRLSAVVDHSNVAVLALDQRGWIVVWNVALANLVGVDAGGALYRRPKELFTLTDEDGRVVDLAPGLRGSVRLATRGGRSLWLRVSCSASAEAMAPGLLTTVFVDESQQRRLEHMRHLLVRSVHHELRGLLAAIRGHGQLLEESLPDDEGAPDSPGAILDAVDVMHQVIGDLVHVVGPDPALPPAMAIRPVEAEPVLRRTLRGLPSVAERTVIAAADGLVVRGDPVRLRQCLLLVFDNAEKYAPDGKIHITLRRQGAYGVISIADEGPGVSPEEYELVRKPYYRSASTRSQPGSGMGLYILDTVMAAMNGRVELATAPSGGLEVRFLLPLSTGPGPEEVR